MKLFTKIFLCCILVFSTAFQVSGYLLVKYAYENAVLQEKKYALNQFQYNKYIIQSAIYTTPNLFETKQYQISNLIEMLDTQVAILDEGQEYIYSDLKIKPDNTIFEQVADGVITYQLKKQDAMSSIVICGQIVQSGVTIYLMTETDISVVVENQKMVIDYFQQLYLMMLGFCAILIFILTHFLTRPINRISRAAKRITEGNYAERIDVSTKDEIGELAENFNQMAETIEEKIGELSNAARQKEDFVANFAHELKTPLTSVIGYADMLYQKDLPGKQVKSAAGYILNEGMRLEALSIKLMDLIVLDKQDFVLEVMSVEEIYQSIVQGIRPVCRRQEIAFHMELDPGYIRVEYDLFKTMILNLIDNARKADSKQIRLLVKMEKEVCRIQVCDDGKGIPTEELGRITEAFYMVDKSRSRKQHGAGLGLALVSKIAEIHGAVFEISSELKKGTTVSIQMDRV